MSKDEGLDDLVERLCVWLDGVRKVQDENIPINGDSLVTFLEDIRDFLKGMEEYTQSLREELAKVAADRDMWLQNNVKMNMSLGRQIAKNERLEAALAAQPAREPVAWVPVHPTQGPLWASCTDSPSPERLPARYPLMPLYAQGKP